MRYERVPVRDEYLEDDEMVVMTEDRRVLALSPLATHALLLLGDGPTEPRVIAESLVERFGPPEEQDIEALTEALLGGMSGTGLVRDLPD